MKQATYDIRYFVNKATAEKMLFKNVSKRLSYEKT